MESLEFKIPDNKGNQLLVALYFYDENQKINECHIPEKWKSVDVIEINITKEKVELPIDFHVFFKLSDELLKIFYEYDNAIMFYEVSFDDLETSERHSHLQPSDYRNMLFNSLKERIEAQGRGDGIYIIDTEVGPDGFINYVRIFFREKHLELVKGVAPYLEGKFH